MATYVTLATREVSEPRRTFNESVVNGKVSTVLLVPEDSYPTVALTISSGTGKVQFTLSSHDTIRKESANWLDWEKGAVSANASDHFVGNVTGLQLVVSSGTVEWDVSI